MKQVEDKFTVDLLGSGKRGRGRPSSVGGGKSGAQRQQEHRKRLRDAGKGVLTVELSLDVIVALDAYVKFKDVTKGDVVDRLLRGSLLRKR